MVVRLRLSRGGRKHRPFYRIVAADSRSPRDGKFIEILGTYDPLPDPDGVKNVSLNFKRARYWLSVGAQPSDTVARLLCSANILPPPPRRGLEESEAKDLSILFSDSSADDAEEGEISGGSGGAMHGTPVVQYMLRPASFVQARAFSPAPVHGAQALLAARPRLPSTTGSVPARLASCVKARCEARKGDGQRKEGGVVASSVYLV